MLWMHTAAELLYAGEIWGVAFVVVVVAATKEHELAEQELVYTNLFDDHHPGVGSRIPVLCAHGTVEPDVVVVGSIPYLRAVGRWTASRPEIPAPTITTST
ncbi:hypothetical protein [Mycobacterium leprae]|uniref:hypothetical protein n=1 Tax=Mycobacterium leprae TaxID=1769 RepID=UPI0002F645DC|nr:hypothetical protein [Mycobacterium leprae]